MTWVWLLGALLVAEKPALARGSAVPFSEGVVVLRSAEGQADGLLSAEQRLIAELRATGLRVVEVPGTQIRRAGETRRVELERLAQQHQAVGAVGLFGHEFGILICVYIIDEPMMRLIEVGAGELAAPDGGIGAVLSAVELINEAVLTFDWPESQPAAAPPAPATRDDPAASLPAAKRLRARGMIGLGAMTSISHWTALPSFMVGGALPLVEVLAVGAELGGTPFGQELDGASRFRLLTMKALLIYEPWPNASWRPALGVGPAFLTVFNDTAGQPGDEVEALWGAAVRLDLGVRLSRSWELRPGLGVLWTARPFNTRVSQRSLSTGEELGSQSQRRTPLLEGVLGGVWSWN